MLIVRPDFERRIDLPGAGPCPRPVDIDRSRTGFSDLVSLRIYSFAQGVAIDGEAEEDEVFIVLMRGEAEIAISKDGLHTGTFSLSRYRGTRAVYMPPHASYRLMALGDCDIAYARAQPLEPELPDTRAFAAAGDRLDIIGHATGMDLALATLLAGEQVRPMSGGRRPERFIHLRAGDAMAATIAGEPLGDWDSVALADGEGTEIRIGAGAADILTISASKSPKTASTGVINEPG